VQVKYRIGLSIGKEKTLHYNRTSFNNKISKKKTKIAISKYLYNNNNNSNSKKEE